MTIHVVTVVASYFICINLPCKKISIAVTMKEFIGIVIKVHVLRFKQNENTPKAH